jgi:putative ABC transport system ATP-binding protein
MYTLEHVSKTYAQSKRRVTALHDVSLTIPKGQLVAIQGPTGGGKSTLLQMLGALDRPSTGRVALGEAELSHLPDRKLAGIRAKEIGFVFQGFNLIPTLTAFENVETALEPSGVAVRPRRSTRSASVIAAAMFRASCRAVSSSGWPSHGHS